jgi:hypothetical protein
MRNLSTQEIAAVSGGASKWSNFFQVASESADALGVPPILRPFYTLALFFSAALSF